MIELTDEERAFLLQVLNAVPITGRDARRVVASIEAKLEKKG